MKSQEFGQSMRNAEEKCKRKELFLSTPHPKVSSKKRKWLKAPDLYICYIMANQSKP